MDVKFKIKPRTGDEKTITASMVDVIAWEEKYERPSSTLSGDSAFARDYVWLAWHAEQRQGHTSLDFMEWVATLEDIESVEEPLVPLESPPPIGSSPD